MEKEVLAACVGALGTAVGALLPPLFSKLFSQQEALPLIPTDIRSTLTGTWAGSGHDMFVADGSPGVGFTMVMQVRAGRKKIVGSISLLPPGKVPEGFDAQPPNIELTMNGGYFTDQYIRLHYESKRAGRRQFGVIMLELSNEQQLHGYYSGLSSMRKVLIAGTVTLTKGVT